jgi:hypothetical protein
MAQTLFHDIIRNSYGPLIKALPLTLADDSYNRDEPEVPTTDVKGVDYAYVSAPGPHQPVSEGKPLLREKYVIVKPPASSLSLLMKLVYGEGAADFRHPFAAEKQRVIWLPEDPLGLVKEITQDLDSHDILHTTEGAKIDAKCYVDVVPEDAQDSPTEGCHSLLRG